MQIKGIKLTNNNKKTTTSVNPNKQIINKELTTKQLTKVVQLNHNTPSQYNNKPIKSDINYQQKHKEEQKHKEKEKENIVKDDPKNFVNLQKRKQAIGTCDDYKPQSELLNSMIENVEQLAVPIQIQSKDDWLASVKETGQSYKLYKQGGPQINWFNKNMNTIYLFKIDETISDEQAEIMRQYCEYFYLGCSVKILKPGSKYYFGKKQMEVPKDFLRVNKIESRMNSGIIQFNASQILKALKDIKPSDAFCILAMTKVDIYPRDEWNFVFGLADMGDQAGVFSFARYGPQFDDDNDKLSSEEQEQMWFKRSIHCMTHEIGHMFGLKHCIYYNCLMNGCMSSEEQKRRSKSTLCPVCIKKLYTNLKFDLQNRFELMIPYCQKIGLNEDAEKYIQILTQFKKTNSP